MALAMAPAMAPARFSSAAPSRPYPKQHGNLPLPSNDEWPLTTWQIFLINLILTGFRNPEGPVDIMSRFLREGVDPYCRILLTENDPHGRVTFCFRRAQCHKHCLSLEETIQFQNGINRCLALRGSPEIDWHINFEQKVSVLEISLREWVAATNWNNRDSLLELMDCSYEEDRDN